MDFHEFNQIQQFKRAWDSVCIERSIPYTLFTFGESVLPYYLVVSAKSSTDPVSVRHGEVKIARPLIVTPTDDRPEFRNFFEDSEFSGMIDFLLSRTAAFSNLRLLNQQGALRLTSDSKDEVVAKLRQKLDDEEEDRVAILSCPSGMAGVALLKYAAERVWESAPGNIAELRERGFLPG